MKDKKNKGPKKKAAKKKEPKKAKNKKSSPKKDSTESSKGKSTKKDLVESTKGKSTKKDVVESTKGMSTKKEVIESTKGNSSKKEVADTTKVDSVKSTSSAKKRLIESKKETTFERIPVRKQTTRTVIEIKRDKIIIKDTEAEKVALLPEGSVVTEDQGRTLITFRQTEKQKVNWDLLFHFTALVLILLTGSIGFSSSIYAYSIGLREHLGINPIFVFP